MSKKVTEELAIGALKERFSVEYAGPEAFIKALEDGTIYSMIDNCAKSMYNGDYTVVVKHLIKNCQDKVCRRKDVPVWNKQKVNGAAMEDAFLAYLQALKAERHIGQSAGQRMNKGKSSTQITIEDIEKITDAEQARRLYNCLASDISKKFGGADDSSLTDEQRAERDNLKACRAAALSKKNELQNKVPKVTKDVASDELIAKLSGGKATLSAKQVEELRKLLGL